MCREQEQVSYHRKLSLIHALVKCHFNKLRLNVHIRRIVYQKELTKHSANYSILLYEPNIS